MNNFLRKYRLRKLAMGGFTMDRPELQSAKGEGIIGKSVLQGAMTGLGAGNSLFGAGSALSGAGGVLAGAGGQAAGLLGKAGGPIGMAASVLAGAGIGLLTGSKQRKKQDEAYKEQYNNEMNEYNTAKSNYFAEKLNQDRQALIDRDNQLNNQMRYGGYIPQYQKGGNTDKDPKAINANKKNNILVQFHELGNRHNSVSYNQLDSIGKKYFPENLVNKTMSNTKLYNTNKKYNYNETMDFYNNLVDANKTQESQNIDWRLIRYMGAGLLAPPALKYGYKAAKWGLKKIPIVKEFSEFRASKAAKGLGVVGLGLLGLDMLGNTYIYNTEENERRRKMLERLKMQESRDVRHK